MSNFHGVTACTNTPQYHALKAALKKFKAERAAREAREAREATEAVLNETLENVADTLDTDAEVPQSSAKGRNAPRRSKRKAQGQVSVFNPSYFLCRR